MKSFELKYILGKVAKLLTIIAMVSGLSFLLVSNSPIDPVGAYIGADMMQIGTEQREIIAERWGLDKPASVRFMKWAGEIAKGNLGHSAIYNESVKDVIYKRFTASLLLMAAAWIFSGIIGFALGLLSGLYEGSTLDRGIRLYCYTMASTPAFWMGLLLLMFFSVYLDLTPMSGATPAGVALGDVTLFQRIHHLLLPAFTLSIVGIAPIALHTREKTIDVLGSNYVLYAKAHGESKAGIVFYHILKNTSLPAITLQFASLGELFGGAVLAEQVFSYPGLGKATVDAGIRGDVPLLLGIVIFSTVFVYTGNTIADYLYRVVDPRIVSEGR